MTPLKMYLAMAQGVEQGIVEDLATPSCIRLGHCHTCELDTYCTFIADSITDSTWKKTYQSYTADLQTQYSNDIAKLKADYPEYFI